MSDVQTVNPQSGLQAAFGLEMHRIYQRPLSEAGYNATRFLHILHDHGGVQTAQLLLHSSTVSEGYTALWERGHLELTVEALIHDNPKWHSLFTTDELAICIKRLSEYGYLKPP